MSNYITTRRRMQKRRKRGMGDWADDFANYWTQQFGGKSETNQCIDAANQKTAELDAKATDLNKNWNPTGIYTTQQMQSLVQQTMATLLAASTGVLDKAISEPQADGTRASLMLKRAAIQRKMSDEGLVFTKALGAAMNANIGVVDAPGLKRWIVNSMLVASDAIGAAYAVSCLTPWWVGVLAAFQSAFDKLYGAAKIIVGTAVALGEQVLKIPDAIGEIWTYAKWGAVGLILWWAYENVPKHLQGA